MMYYEKRLRLLANLELVDEDTTHIFYNLPHLSGVFPSSFTIYLCHNKRIGFSK